jgi:hypothetical protein
VVTRKLLNLRFFATHNIQQAIVKTSQMKKLSCSAAFMLATLLLAVNNGSAQTSAPLINLHSVQGVDSPVEPAAAVVSVIAVVEEPKVHPKALRSLRKTFNASTPIKWYSDEHCYIAYFTEGGIQHRVTYKKNGSWYQTLKRYSAEHFDEDAKKDIEDTFDGYDIIGVSELNVGGERLYFVNIQSRRKLKEVLLYDGQISVRKEFTVQ